MRTIIIVAAVRCDDLNCRARGINCLNCIKRKANEYLQDLTEDYDRDKGTEEMVEDLIPDLMEAYDNVVKGEREWSVTTFPIDKNEDTEED